MHKYFTLQEPSPVHSSSWISYSILQNETVGNTKIFCVLRGIFATPRLTKLIGEVTLK